MSRIGLSQINQVNMSGTGLDQVDANVSDTWHVTCVKL